MSRVLIALTFLFCLAGPAQAAPACDEDGYQASGSIYRICMPEPGTYNGSLVIWAHGFQDAGTPVSIPENQLCITDTFCLNTIVNSLGFGFATNSYSKTGLAIAQGKDDVKDLVQIYTRLKGKPNRVYIIGASEGGLITALSVEQSPDVFSAGVAACGPIGNFPAEINFLGDGRVTFNYFFPDVIPGDPFRPDPELVEMWETFYESDVEPVIFDDANRGKLDAWVRVAQMPYDPADYINSLRISVRDMLRYGVVNITDAAETIGGSIFDNSTRWYSGSDNDLLLNLTVARIAVDPAALAAMLGPSYSTTGVLTRPLVTLHTLRDQQVPYAHEWLYLFKTLSSGSFLTRHFHIPIDRFEHCNFTADEALVSFFIMLIYDGLTPEVSGVASVLTSPDSIAAFEANAKKVGLKYRLDGPQLRLKIKNAK